MKPSGIVRARASAALGKWRERTLQSFSDFFVRNGSAAFPGRPNTNKYFCLLSGRSTVLIPTMTRRQPVSISRWTAIHSLPSPKRTWWLAYHVSLPCLAIQSPPRMNSVRSGVPWISCRTERTAWDCSPTVRETVATHSMSMCSPMAILTDLSSAGCIFQWCFFARMLRRWSHRNP